MSQYRTRIFCMAGLGPAAALACITAPAIAQDDTMTAIETPAQPTAIALGTGPLPGASTPESWHSQYGSMFARNVTEATLTPFLPAEGKASGAAVIVAPGGGFRALSMENEGWDVARSLAERGVAAFVLKYRLDQTPADLEAVLLSLKVATAATLGGLPVAILVALALARGRFPGRAGERPQGIRRTDQ